MNVTLKKGKLQSLENALNTPFMKSDSKALIKAAWHGRLKDFADRLMRYRWFGTRDYTMALIIFAVIVAANNDSNLKQGLKIVAQNRFNKLVKLIGEGDGRELKKFLESQEGIWFHEIFMGLLSNHGSSPNHALIVQTWTGFITQVQKMRPWKKNRGIKENLASVLAEVFGNSVADKLGQPNTDTDSEPESESESEPAPKPSTASEAERTSQPNADITFAELLLEIKDGKFENVPLKLLQDEYFLDEGNFNYFAPALKLLEDVMTNLWKTEPIITLYLKDAEKKRSYFSNFFRLKQDIFDKLLKKQEKNAELARKIYGGLMRCV